MKKFAIQIEIRDGGVSSVRSQRVLVQFRSVVQLCIACFQPQPTASQFPPDLSFSLFLSTDREDSRISSARVLRYAIFGSLDGFAGRDCLGWWLDVTRRDCTVAPCGWHDWKATASAAQHECRKPSGHHWFEALDAAPKTGDLAKTSWQLMQTATPFAWSCTSNTDRGLGHCGKGPGRFTAATGSGILYIHLIAVDSVARADSEDAKDESRSLAWLPRLVVETSSRIWLGQDTHHAGALPSWWLYPQGYSHDLCCAISSLPDLFLICFLINII